MAEQIFPKQLCAICPFNDGTGETCVVCEAVDRTADAYEVETGLRWEDRLAE